MIVKNANSKNGLHKLRQGDVLRLESMCDSYASETKCDEPETRYVMIAKMGMMDEYEEDEMYKYGVVQLSNENNEKGCITSDGLGEVDVVEELFDDINSLIKNLHQYWDRVEFAPNLYGVDGNNAED